MAALIEALALRRRTTPWSEHLDELKACKDAKALFHWFHNDFERPFPPPPWPGDDLLVPIADAETQRRIGAPWSRSSCAARAGMWCRS